MRALDPLEMRAEGKNYQTYNALIQKYLFYTVYLSYAIMLVFDT
jgi:hypothetical protein